MVTMMTPTPARSDSQTYAHKLIEHAATLRLSELFTQDCPRAIHRSPERHGVRAVVIRTADLREHQLLKLLRFRTAQYLAVNMIDAGMVKARGMEHDPLTSVNERDVHVIVGAAATGEILSSIWVRVPPDMEPGTTLR